jgi:hypothetical protein
VASGTSGRQGSVWPGAEVMGGAGDTGAVGLATACNRWVRVHGVTMACCGRCGASLFPSEIAVQGEDDSGSGDTNELEAVAEPATVPRA